MWHDITEKHSFEIWIHWLCHVRTYIYFTFFIDSPDLLLDLLSYSILPICITLHHSQCQEVNRTNEDQQTMNKPLITWLTQSINSAWHDTVGSQWAEWQGISQRTSTDPFQWHISTHFLPPSIIVTDRQENLLLSRKFCV